MSLVTIAKATCFLLSALAGLLYLLHTVRAINEKGFKSFFRMLRDNAATLPATSFSHDWLLALLVVWWAVGAVITGFRSPSHNQEVIPSLDMLLSASAEIGAVLILLAAVLHLEGVSWRNWLGMHRLSLSEATLKGFKGALLMILPVWLLTVGSHLALSLLGHEVEPQVVLRFLKDGHLSLPQELLMVLNIVVIAPVSEEFIFRGYLLPRLSGTKGRVFKGIMLSSLFFAAMHLHLGAFVPLFGIGMACSLGYLTTKNLLTPIIMHAMVNSLGVFSLY